MRPQQIILCLLSALIILAGLGCSERPRDGVLVILRTKSYHTDLCPRVRMAKIRLMTIAEARELNCLPCPGCKPGTLE